MTRIVAAIVILGLAMAVALAVRIGLDITALIILAVLVAVGAAAIRVAQRSEVGATRPAVCEGCGGLMSPNAPYCKHCGRTVEV